MRVAFFTHFPFHRPILEPIRDVLTGGAELLLSSARDAIVAFDPDVLVMTSHAHLEAIVPLPSERGWDEGHRR